MLYDQESKEYRDLPDKKLLGELVRDGFACHAVSLFMDVYD